MSEIAVKRFVNELAGKVGLIVMGVALIVNSGFFGNLIDDRDLSEFVAVNTRLIGIIIIIFGSLNIITSYYLAIVEKEEIYPSDK